MNSFGRIFRLTMFGESHGESVGVNIDGCPAGLPLTLLFPLYPALLLIPAWRNRSNGAARVVMHHLAYGWGILVELVAR